jgi:hypothetical protein
VRRRLAATIVVLAIAIAGCGGDDDTQAPYTLAVETTVDFDPGTEPVALAPLDGGDLLVGERRTGVVRTVSTRGELSEPVARLDVVADEEDQRGLLGLAADGQQIYATWTRASDGHIVIAEITNGTERLVWLGPPSSRLANGGHLDVLPDGRLLVGIGDLQQPDRVEDPETPHGKLLTLDPAGAPEQLPVPLSGGWNNPFAFVVTSDGDVWAADNSPGDAPERLGRGDIDTARTALPGRRAPAALVELGPDLLGLCSHLDGDITTIDLHDDHPQPGDPVATGCRTGAAALGDDRIAVTDGERLRILAKTS